MTKKVVRGGEIKALTGLRVIAAFWVVLFHFRPLLEQAAPEFRTALNPILSCGAQGVDLFFILSGFVLTWNYLDKMGQRWSTKETLHFLWLRLARVWPVYLVTMHLAALWVIFTMHVGHVPEHIDSFDATNYVRQLFMVQLWFRPYFDFSSWNGPAWSISAEWLAYLLFGALVLVIFRIARATSPRALMVLAVLACLPPVMLLLVSGQFYTPWSWLPRIVMQFTAGALACAAVRQLKLSRRSRHVAGYVALLIIALIVGALYVLDAHPISGVVDSSGVVDVLFVPLVIALAAGIGPLPALLGTRVMVYGGQISFGLYMVHELVHVAWTWATQQFELSLLDPGGGWIMIGLLVLAVVLSMALYHWVEEPGRRWMRRMMGVAEPAVAEPAVTEPAVVEPVVADHHAGRNGHSHQVPEKLAEPARAPLATGATTR